MQNYAPEAATARIDVHAQPARPTYYLVSVVLFSHLGPSSSTVASATLRSPSVFSCPGVFRVFPFLFAEIKVRSSQTCFQLHYPVFSLLCIMILAQFAGSTCTLTTFLCMPKSNLQGEELSVLPFNGLKRLQTYGEKSLCQVKNQPVCHRNKES